MGVAFPGDATLVPVDLLVQALWLNADQPAEEIAPYMALRLKAMMTSPDIGVEHTVSAEAFRAAAAAYGFSATFITAFVPHDIGESSGLKSCYPSHSLCFSHVTVPSPSLPYPIPSPITASAVRARSSHPQNQQPTPLCRHHLLPPHPSSPRRACRDYAQGL